MTTATIGEYLRCQHEPAQELVAGEVIDKPMGTLEHMGMERKLVRLLERFEELGWGTAMAELSFRHGDEVRIPDVVFYRSSAQFEEGLLVDPPLLCIEVLSPSQRQSELFAKCEMYHRWGVPYCWVIDPILTRAWEYHQGGAVRLIAEGDALRAGEITTAWADLNGL